MLCQYLVLLHSPDTRSPLPGPALTPCECESSLRVLPRIVCKIFVNEYNSAESGFIHPPTPRVFPRLRPGRLSPGDALDPRHERTASDAPSASLGHHGMHSLLQKRHQLRSARVRPHTVFDKLLPLAEHSADILVPPCPQTPAQYGFFRSHLLVICAAKPRYTAAAAREHRSVLAPRLPTSCASVTSPLHTPREVPFEMCQRRVLLARIKGEVRQVQFCKCMAIIQGSQEKLCRLTHSIIQARRCRRVTMRSRSLISASRALATCPDAKGEGDTHFECCEGLLVCKLQRYCQDCCASK
jgi:hypothetical protein